MNKDQVKGAAKNTVGKVQRATGKLVGSRKQEVAGVVKQVEGKAQQRLGDVKEAVKSARTKSRR
ncbi:MAG: CsbD family protein [Planctomycetes bacterium]|nr:CsbD family protein [Planctomycetota bacterium]